MSYIENDKEREAIEQYPELFGEDAFDVHKSLMAFGFETSKYWTDIILESLPGLSEIVLRDSISFKIVQVKEKFGSLSLYYVGGNDETRAYINSIENKCNETCEKCGSKEGVFRPNGWFRVTCDDCENKTKEK